jgi:polyisoprenoid-binding protein YceI
VTSDDVEAVDDEIGEGRKVFDFPQGSWRSPIAESWDRIWQRSPDFRRSGATTAGTVRPGVRSKSMTTRGAQRNMAPSGEMTTRALQALLKDGALTGGWVLDPRRSSIGHKSTALWGLARGKGVFGEVSGNGTVSPNGEISGTVTVAVASIDTKNTRRDKHLRSADFFDSGNCPHITFVVDDVRPSGRGVTVSGALTVRDRTRPRRRGPHQPGLRPHLGPDWHGVDENHPHHPRRIHPAVRTQSPGAVAERQRLSDDRARPPLARTCGPCSGAASR